MLSYVSVICSKVVYYLEGKIIMAYVPTAYVFNTHHQVHDIVSHDHTLSKLFFLNIFFKFFTFIPL